MKLITADNTTLCEDNALVWDNHTFSWESLSDFNSIEKHYIGWTVCGVLTILSCLVSLVSITRHLRNFNQRNEQREIVRILFIVPIYSILSWLSFYWFRYAVYFELIRDVYEAFVIYSFFNLLLLYMGGNRHIQHISLLEKPRMSYPPPFCCGCTYAPQSPYFLTSTRNLVTQYIVIKPVMAIFAIVTQLYHNYCPESMSWRHGHFWTTVVNIVAVSTSMLGIFILFLTVKDDIAVHSPAGKFMSVKVVILLTVWQKAIITSLVHYDVIPRGENWTRTNVANGILALLVCTEMLLTGIWHIYAFPIEEYKRWDPETRRIVYTKVWGRGGSVLDVLDPRELIREVQRLGQFVRFWMAERAAKKLAAAASKATGGIIQIRPTRSDSQRALNGDDDDEDHGHHSEANEHVSPTYQNIQMEIHDTAE